MPARRLRAMVSALAMAIGSNVLLAEDALSHAVILDVREARAIAVDARYDTGQPMVDAQVSVFSPENPQQPWLSGLTDGRGQFVFIPGTTQGRWTIQTRQAGHGSMAYIDLPADAATASLVTGSSLAQSGISPIQRAVMAVSIVWGLVGTALYFRRKGVT